MLRLIRIYLLDSIVLTNNVKMQYNVNVKRKQIKLYRVCLKLVWKWEQNSIFLVGAGLMREAEGE